MKLLREHPDGRRRDWPDIVVQGVCGLLAGTIIGFLSVARELPFGPSLWTITASAALGFGVLTALFGDRVWGLILWLLSRF